MKHIKKFEGSRYNNKYRLGDYLLIKNDFHDIKLQPSIVVEEHSRGLDAAKIQLVDGREFWVWDDDIIRDLSPQEKQKFESDREAYSTANKYNL